MEKYKVLLIILLVLSILFAPQEVHAESKNEVFRYVLSSDASSGVAGTFQSSVQAFPTVRSQVLGTKVYYYFTKMEVYFHPLNTSSVGSGSLTYNPTVRYHMSDSVGNVSLGSAVSVPGPYTWTGDASYFYFAYGYQGSARLSYREEQFDVVSSNSFSLSPTSDSSSFMLLLDGSEGGSLSYSGTSNVTASGFTTNMNKDSVTWSYDVDQQGSWSSPDPFYYVVGVDSGAEFGPFDFGVEYPLSDVPSWNTEEFYLKSIIKADSDIVANVAANTGSFYNTGIAASSGNKHVYRNFSVSSSVAPLSLTVDVVFPGNKEVTDYLDEIINGYDNPKQDDDNKLFEDSQKELQDAEDSLFSSASAGFGDLDMADYELGKFTNAMNAFQFVSGFLQSVYIKSGDFGKIVAIGFVILIASKVIGLYRFSTGDGDEGG